MHNPRRIHATLFQFSPPRGGRPHCQRRSAGGYTHFNSRPRVGGVAYVVGACRAGDISILAPAWGASQSTSWRQVMRSISILAPAWGASPPKARQRLFSFYFNSRPRVGGVGRPQKTHRPSGAISILAPAWGASRRGRPCVVRLLIISILAPAWGASEPMT